MTDDEAYECWRRQEHLKLVLGTTFWIRDDDERQEACLVLLTKAIGSFDPEKGGWNQHARRWIRWALHRWWAKEKHERVGQLPDGGPTRDRRREQLVSEKHCEHVPIGVCRRCYQREYMQRRRAKGGR